MSPFSLWDQLNEALDAALDVSPEEALEAAARPLMP